jgi:hypothetical protein
VHGLCLAFCGFAWLKQLNLFDPNQNGRLDDPSMPWLAPWRKQPIIACGLSGIFGNIAILLPFNAV